MFSQKVRIHFALFAHYEFALIAKLIAKDTYIKPTISSRNDFACRNAVRHNVRRKSY